jgi:hypothetical protein
MRYSLRNMPKRRASLRPWFANFSTSPDRESHRRVRPTDSSALRFGETVFPAATHRISNTSPGSDCPVEMPCQSSGENAKRLTAPFAFVNSRNVAPACACPLSAFQSCHSSSIGMPVAPLSPAAAGSLSQVAASGSPSTPKEREYA